LFHRRELVRKPGGVGKLHLVSEFVSQSKLLEVAAEQGLNKRF
jgi:hypothetical protein